MSNKVISQTLDNLKFYRYKNSKKLRRCTTRAEDEIIEASNYQYRRSKRAGTTTDAAEIDLFNHKEPPKEYSEYSNAKVNKLSKSAKKPIITDSPCDQIEEDDELESPMHNKYITFLLKSVSSPGGMISDFTNATETDDRENSKESPEPLPKEKNEDVEGTISLSEEDSGLNSEEDIEPQT